MTLKWIAQRLQAGRWTYLSNCLIKMRKTESVKMYDPIFDDGKLKVLSP